MLISQNISSVHVEQHLEAWMFIIWLNLQNPDGLPCPAVYLYISKKSLADDTTLCDLLQLLYAPKEHFLLLTYSTFGTSTEIQEFQDIMQPMQHQGIDLFMAHLLQIQTELHKELFLALLFPHTVVL